MALDRAWTWTESECGPRIDLLKKFLFKYFVSAHTVSYINTDYTISKDIEKKNRISPRFSTDFQVFDTVAKKPSSFLIFYTKQIVNIMSTIQQQSYFSSSL